MDAIVDACHRTNNGQEHKIIWRAGPEQDFLLTCHSVQRARQPLSRRAISLGSFTGAVDFVLQLIRFESLGSELQQSYITTFILLNLPVMRMRVWIITKSSCLLPLDMGTTVPNCNHGNVYSQVCTCAV